MRFSSRRPVSAASALALFAAALFALSFPARLARAQTPTRPSLVVVISVGQMRADYLARFRPWFGKDGYNRFLERGAVWPEARHRHATTFTGLAAWGPGVRAGAYDGHVSAISIARTAGALFGFEAGESDAEVLSPVLGRETGIKKTMENESPVEKK